MLKHTVRKFSPETKRLILKNSTEELKKRITNLLNNKPVLERGGPRGKPSKKSKPKNGKMDQSNPGESEQSRLNPGGYLIDPKAKEQAIRIT